MTSAKNSVQAIECARQCHSFELRLRIMGAPESELAGTFSGFPYQLLPIYGTATAIATSAKEPVT
jgi:hypothetical protein